MCICATSHCKSPEDSYDRIRNLQSKTNASKETPGASHQMKPIVAIRSVYSGSSTAETEKWPSQQTRHLAAERSVTCPETTLTWLCRLKGLESWVRYPRPLK